MPEKKKPKPSSAEGEDLAAKAVGKDPAPSESSNGPCKNNAHDQYPAQTAKNDPPGEVVSDTCVYRK